MSYNGWTNWETWTINMEYFTDMDFDQMKEVVVQDSLQASAESCKTWVAMIDVECGAFERGYPFDMDKVDWVDLAETLLIDFSDSVEYRSNN